MHTHYLSQGTMHCNMKHITVIGVPLEPSHIIPRGWAEGIIKGTYCNMICIIPGHLEETELHHKESCVAIWFVFH